MACPVSTHVRVGHDTGKCDYIQLCHFLKLQHTSVNMSVSVLHRVNLLRKPQRLALDKDMIYDKTL